MDMDPPSDWKMAHDVFSGISMLDPGTSFIIYTRNMYTDPVQALVKKGALCFEKPVRVQELKETLGC